MLLVLPAPTALAQAMLQIIPYQGLLESDGAPVNATVTLNFALFDCEDCAGPPLWVASLQNPGSIVWPAPTAPGVAVDVNSGRFSAALGGAGHIVLPETLFEAEELYACERVFQWGENVSNGFFLYFCDAGSNLQFGAGSDMAVQTPVSTLLDGAWHHLAVTRQSGTLRLFVDGNVVHTNATWRGANTATVPLYFSTYPGTPGDAGSYFISGYLDNLRMVVGRALWTANFTPSEVMLDMTQRVMVVEVGRVVAIE